MIWFINATHVTPGNTLTVILLHGRYPVAVESMNIVTAWISLQTPWQWSVALFTATETIMTQVYMNQHSSLSVCSLTLTSSGYYQYFYPTSFRLKAATRYTICTVQLSQTLENKALVCSRSTIFPDKKNRKILWILCAFNVLQGCFHRIRSVVIACLLVGGQGATTDCSVKDRKKKFF